MPIQGLRDTSNFVTNARPENWREGILLLDPNGMASLTGLTSLMKKRKVDDPLFHWWEKSTQTRRVALHATSGDLTLVNTTLTLTSAGGALGLKEGDILRVEQSGEHLLVTQDPSSDTSITVSRAFAGTTAATVDANGNNVNPNLMVIGNAYEEGSLAPTGVAFDPTEKTNRTQIFRDTLEATRTAQKTRLRTGDEIKEAKRECLLHHSMGMERAFWFGKKALTTKNGKPLHTMDGLINFVDSGNIKVATTDYASGITMAGLEEYMYEIFKYGSSEKMAFCGNRSALVIQQILRKNAAWQFTSGIKEYGMNVSRVISPFGELVIKTHKGFNQITGGTTGTGPYYGLESWFWVLDMDNLMYVYMDDTMYEKDLGANGLDGMKSGYLTECSIEVHHPTTHYLIKNMVAAAADS